MNDPLYLITEAEQELFEAGDEYNAIREGLGDDFLEEVDTVLDRIRRGPRLFPIAMRTARVALVDRFPYIVVYAIANERIRVVAIQHARRDPASWQSRLD